MEESIENKQLYLRNEIIMKGYDPHDFSIFLTNLKGEEKVDLEYWSLDEIKEAVDKYKISKQNKEKKENKENKEKEEFGKTNTENTIKIKKKKFQFFKNILRRKVSIDLVSDTNEPEDKNDTNIIKTDKNEINTIQPSEYLYDQNDQNGLNGNNDRIEKLSDKIISRHVNKKEKIENIIKCEKLEKNELTDRNDLNVIVSPPTKIKKNKFSNLILYNIETNPLGFKTLRQLNDFEYLFHKLLLINSQVFISPFLKKKKSNKQVLFLNFYLNSLMENPYYRSLPIIYDFLSLSLDDWEKVKMEKYDNIKEVTLLNKIKNLDGFFNIDVKVGDKEFFLKIKEDISQKTEIFNKFNTSLKELFNVMDKMSSSIKNLKDSLSEFKNKCQINQNCINYFAYFEVIIKEWGECYIRQKNYLKNELQYFFKYMNKENNSFLKFYEIFKSNYDFNKLKYEKLNKNNEIQNEKDKEIIKNLKIELKYNLMNTNSEYKKLNERQALRIENLLFNFGANQKEIFTDIQAFLSLINVFKEKREEEKKYDESKEKINKDNKNVELNINNINIINEEKIDETQNKNN